MDLDRDRCYRALLSRDPRFDGRFFVAVRTTGIYCRPICPARGAKFENLTFYPTAAAAQSAGYRPCLRCRPECSPGVGSWRGTSNTVSRALALIDEGALHEGNVDALAGRLGVGERQLRRLFRQHIGASPIAVVQTRRVLLAKQLIHETRLPMTEVALASGFGSVRRFNETFRQLFGRPPTALRRERVNGVSISEAGSTIHLTLAFRPPYGWRALAEFLRMRATTGVEVATAQRYARTIDVDGVRGHIAVAPSARPNRLDVTIRVPRVTALPSIILRLRRVFDLDAEPQTIAAHLAEDPALSRLLRRRPGLRVPGAWDPFELAVRAVLGQQISVGAATQLAGRLVAAFGRRYDDPQRPEGLTHLFPSPRRLRDADVASIGMPRARGAAISALAAAALADPGLFDPGRNLAGAVQRLRAIPGIGEWTAQYIAMRALHSTDAFPAGDVGLQRALAVNGDRPTASQLLSRAESWRPWRAYAALHLWSSDGAGSGRKENEKDEAGRSTT